MDETNASDGQDADGTGDGNANIDKYFLQKKETYILISYLGKW